MPNIDSYKNIEPFLNGGGEMARLIREKDWSQTPIGHPSTWPQCLKTMVSVMLENPFGMYIAWGEEYTQIYNDGYRPILGTEKHPKALGASTRETYAEIFDIVKPMFKEVMSGKAVNISEFQLQLNRNGYNENCYFDVSYSPIRLHDGTVGGILTTIVETTKKKKALDDLKEKEEEISAFVESAPFPIGVYKGKEMRIVLANQSILDTWGKGNNVIGKLFAEVLPEFENQQIYKQLDDVYTTGIPIHKKNQLVNIIKKGELKTHYFNYSLTPLFDAGGTIYGVMNTAAEVTELNEAKQKVEQVLEETKLFKYMIDNSADSFILMDRKGNFTYLNDVGVQKWGYSKEELKQLKVSDINPTYKEEKFQDLFKITQKRNIPNFETWLKTKNGTYFLAEISFGNVEFEGERYMLAVSRDITDRKKAEKELLTAFHKVEDSEKRFRDSVEQAPLGIAIFRGPDYVVELANEAYLLLIDKRPDKIIHLPFFTTHPELTVAIKPLFDQVIQTGEPFFGNEFPVLLNRTGKLEQCFFNLVYYPLKEETGEISGIMAVAVEVTETVKAKNLLAISEKNFRNLVNSSPIGMTILKRDQLRVEIVNKMMLKSIWQKTEEEVVGKPLLEIFPEFTDQKYPDLLEQVLQTGVTYAEREAPVYFKTNHSVKEFFLDIEFSPLSDGTGNISGIMVTANDVTDKVESRKLVENAEERLRLATEATGVSTWDLDLGSRVIIHSRRLAEIFGHPAPTNLIHKEMLRQIHPQDAHILQNAFAIALKTGTYQYEARVIKPDHSISWISTRGKVFYDEAHKPVKMLGTLRDITKERNYQHSLEESESKFRLLSNAIAQQVWLSDPLGNLYYFNETVNTFSGLSNQQLIDFGWLEMVHPEDRDENTRVWKESISTGKEFLFEHRFRRFDGEYRWQLSRALPQKDASGNIQMWVGSSTDIQEIKEQEQQKDLFISIASHELKTPLTSIKGYVQIMQSMKSGINEAFLEKALGIMDKQVNKLTQLIAELLDVSKIKSGGLDFDKEEFEMTELIDEVVTEIKHINPLYAIPVTVKQPIKVYADRNRIGQVLINFLNNAIKYSPNSLEVKIMCHPSENGVIVSVEDSGIGIVKREQKNIFQQFYRVEGTNETTYPGFGIGLFISSEIIRRHNGNIILKSEYGKGSVFSFEIPVK